MKLEFDEASHTYSVGGQKVPNVTLIMEPLIDYSKVPRAILQAAMERGNYVHKACELYVWDMLDESDVPPEYQPYIDGFKLFLKETGFEAELVEHRVFHKTLKYAGTLDLAGSLPCHRQKSKRAVIDIKSTFRMMESVGPQTAAYADAYASDKPKELHFQERYGLRLTADGKYELKPMKDIGDMTVFRSCLNLYNYFNRRKSA